MWLRRLLVEGYRSIRDPLQLDFDKNVTVLLGANDHGKTNVLEAIRHLNGDAPFDGASDLNWDLYDRDDEFPSLVAEFSPSEDERSELLARANAERRLLAIDDAIERAGEHAQRLKEVLERAEQRASESEASEVPNELMEAIEVAKQHLGDFDLVVAAYALDRRLMLSRVVGETIDIELELMFQRDEADEAEAVRGRAEREVRRLERAFAQLEAKGDDPGAIEAMRGEIEVAKAALQEADELAQEERRAYEELEFSAKALDQVLAEDVKIPVSARVRLTGRQFRMADMPDRVSVQRVGVNGSLDIAVEGGAERVAESGAARDYALSLTPRVELIEPMNEVPDSATASNIDDPEMEFMRGIFHYAGLDPDAWENLFEKNDFTQKALQTASDVLTQTIRTSWSQGQDLAFHLSHDGDAIELKIDDPVVGKRLVRASHRSSGFTSFFALKTVLHARARENAGAKSFIWLFDEPGLYLHPDGQHDLLQAIEALGADNQIVYTTHSIFLVNRNFPTRHRLLKKVPSSGTALDAKPYVGRWHAVMSALGLAYPGTALFASSILLVEGDSDVVFLAADLGAMVAAGELDADTNALAVLATNNAADAKAIIRLLGEAAMKPRLVLLLDGDDGGRDRKAALRKVCSQHRIEVIDLDPDRTIEDELVAPECFRDAAINYIVAVANLSGAEATDAKNEMRQSYGDRSSASGWLDEVGERYCGGKPSKVGIAREYATALAGGGAPAVIPESAIELGRRLSAALQLSGVVAEARVTRA